MKLKTATTVKLSIDELNPAEYNPRRDLQPEDPEYKKLLKSIQKFGYVLYIVVNKDMTVIGGHQRLKILKDLGYTEIEVTQVDLNKKDEKALNLALNKIDGIWDYDMLGDMIRGLNTDGFDFEVTGFSDTEVMAFTDDIDMGFSFNTQSESTDGGDYDSNDNETPDDMVEVEGDPAGGGFVLQIGFSEKERAIAFLEHVGYDDLKFPSTTKRVFGDNIAF